ncbi:MAG: hypothetical protein A2860_00195 [Candidatus Levybacteria bacterium RIFCSPHIGHO2_01_FULL_37_33]|nr:MAG: hypothetical protein A2860_00195 [Candidatus Levybacteria bacterium RIFCSPHIGHO2_01_FULL_37_33]OGH17592.1 MAG: hypothetical protein A3C97_01710 [Candidatus Levybacteria bacterium RIFCSPHIGHO2_02_FULL_37_11]OGH29040.1 MAG: hypothetical protein A3F30_03400 [Candidatus Levybacteria bacterium RIFCSPHIGHO2_12_FULL_37_12]OGH33150.1 MAG: hypothetical protein A2953_00410 [Candidatus Levybacteria bacterium RIFCSPLOWO2_01_FULL_36_54]
MLGFEIDIKKFFASVDHKILLELIEKRIRDKDTLWLLREVIQSFKSEIDQNRGIPLGNLTSQIFANIYLNELDKFIKHKLKIRYYLRYADDFLFLSSDKEFLRRHIDKLRSFLNNNLKLELHPDKISLRRLEWGVDFLGYIVLPHYILPRTKTERRMVRKIKEKINSYSFNQSLASYLGYLIHSNSYNFANNLKNEIWLLLAK